MQLYRTRFRIFSIKNMFIFYIKIILSSLLMIVIILQDVVPISSQDNAGLSKLDLNPRWSADGSSLAFESWRNGNSDIWLYEFDTETIVNLTSDSEVDEYSPVWFPDGNEIIYVSENHETLDIHSVNIHTLKSRNLTNTPEVDEFDPAISNDGRYLAFVARTEERQDIKILDFESEELINVTENANIEIFGLPNWYKQSNQVVFTDNPLLEQTNLWVSIAEFRTIQQVTIDGSDTIPIWSPVDPIIAMMSRRSGNLDIWIFDTETEEYTNLTPSNSRIDTDPTWSPDGTEIAYSASSGSDANDSRFDIWVVNLETGEQRNLTENLIEASSPVWSPIDNRIVFISFEGQTTLWVINSDGKDAINLTK